MYIHIHFGKIERKKNRQPSTKTFRMKQKDSSARENETNKKRLTQCPTVNVHSKQRE